MAGVRAGSRLLPAVLAAAVVALTGCGSSVSDPESARCNAPQVTFGHKVVLADHAEVEVTVCSGLLAEQRVNTPAAINPVGDPTGVKGSQDVDYILRRHLNHEAVVSHRVLGSAGGMPKLSSVVAVPTEDDQAL